MYMALQQATCFSAARETVRIISEFEFLEMDQYWQAVQRYSSAFFFAGVSNWFKWLPFVTMVKCVAEQMALYLVAQLHMLSLQN